MARFHVIGTPDRAVEMPLVATVEILSKFHWKTDVLEKRLAAAGGKCGAPRVTNRRSTKIFTIYSISWGLLLSYSGVVEGPEERLQQQAESILAVFNEMEEKVEAARAVEDPLSWVSQASMTDPDIGMTGIPNEKRENDRMSCCHGWRELEGYVRNDAGELLPDPCFEESLPKPVTVCDQVCHET